MNPLKTPKKLKASNRQTLHCCKFKRHNLELSLQFPNLRTSSPYLTSRVHQTPDCRAHNIARVLFCQVLKVKSSLKGVKTARLARVHAHPKIRGVL